MISLLSCFCLAASASLAFLSIAAFERAVEPERLEVFDLAVDPERLEVFDLAVDFVLLPPDEVFVFAFLFPEAMLYLYFHSSSNLLTSYEFYYHLVN